MAGTSDSGENGEAPRRGGDAGLLPPRGGGAGPRRQMRGTGKPAPQEAQTRRLSVGRIARQLWFLRKVKGSPAELCSETMTTSRLWLYSRGREGSGFRLANRPLGPRAGLRPEFPYQLRPSRSDAAIGFTPICFRHGALRVLKNSWYLPSRKP